MPIDFGKFSTRRVLPVFVGLFFCFALGNFLYFNLLGPEAREARRFFKLMPADEIRAVVLEPGPHDPNPLSSQVISISDRDQINTIADLLHSARSYHPNHPHQKWATIVHLRVKDREFSGQLSSTTNQGVLFYYGLDTDGGPVYGTYRQDALGPLVEKIVREQAAR